MMFFFPLRDYCFNRLLGLSLRAPSPNRKHLSARPTARDRHPTRDLAQAAQNTKFAMCFSSDPQPQASPPPREVRDASCMRQCEVGNDACLRCARESGTRCTALQRVRVGDVALQHMRVGDEDDLEASPSFPGCCHVHVPAAGPRPWAHRCKRSAAQAQALIGYVHEGLTLPLKIFGNSEQSRFFVSPKMANNSHTAMHAQRRIFEFLYKPGGPMYIFRTLRGDARATSCTFFCPASG